LISRTKFLFVRDNSIDSPTIQQIIGGFVKLVRTLGLSTVLAMTMGVAVAQDAANDVDKAGKKTGHVVAKAGKKIGRETKAGAEDVGHGTKAAARDTAKGVKAASVKTADGVKDGVTK
jgi:hypothetical protein